MSRIGMNGRDQKLTLDGLERLLDAYGGDFSRWPERQAADAQVLIGSSNDARRLHLEAQALDRLLAKASVPDPARLDKLAERIMATAAREGLATQADAIGKREVPAGARIIPMPVNGRANGSEKARAPQAGPAPLASRPSKGRWFGDVNWQAAAALAASLAFGIAIGVSDVAPTATYNVASLVQPAASDTETVLSELQLDAWNGLDEDQI